MAAFEVADVSYLFRLSSKRGRYPLANQPAGLWFEGRLPELSAPAAVDF